MSALIFDLDGTLADTLRDIMDALNHALHERGLPVHDRDAYRQLVGEGARQLVRDALPVEQRDRVDEVLAAYRLRYAEHMLVHSRPYPGIRELLAELQRRRVPLAVLSNKPHEPTVKITSALFPDIRFTGVLGQRTGVPRKPDPTAALELCTALNCAPSEVGFLGDTRIDMQTARSAGMTAIGVQWGFRDAAELQAHGAHHLLAHPSELLALL